MDIKFVGMKAFRQNMAKMSEEACKKNRRLIVLKKNKPIFEVHPLSKKQQFIDDILRRTERAKTGKTYSSEEVRSYLGLD